MEAAAGVIEKLKFLSNGKKGLQRNAALRLLADSRDLIKGPEPDKSLTSESIWPTALKGISVRSVRFNAEPEKWRSIYQSI